MKCDDFLPAIETGGFLSRLAARRHARRCPRCAAALKMLGKVKKELASPAQGSPLPAHLRRRWLAAARTSSDSIRLRRVFSGILLKRAAALAAVLLIVLIPLLVYKFHKRDEPTKPGLVNAPHIVPHDVITTGPITIVKVDRAAELALFDTEIVRLQDDIRSLLRSAERLQAQQRIALVLAQNTNW